MAEYEVTLPITGYAYLTVEAESEAEAIEKALNEEDVTFNDIQEWSAVKDVVRGNVWYGVGSAHAAAVRVGGDE